MMFVSTSTFIGCDASSQTGSISWKPPFSPVAISWTTTGDISVSGDKKVVTPIGLFEFGVSETLHSREGYTLVVLRDRDSKKETVYEVRGDGEYQIDHPASVIVKNGRVEIELERGVSNTIYLNYGESKPHSEDEYGVVDSITVLIGNWKASNGDLYAVNQTHTGLSLKVISSHSLEWGEAELIRDGQNYKGVIKGVFRSDPQQRSREAPVYISLISSNRASLTTDSIVWDQWGQESGRCQCQMLFSKVE